MANDGAIGSWVPQLFYDLIARVVPGATLILSMTAAVTGPDNFWEALNELVSSNKEYDRSVMLVIFIGLLGSYVGGWLLSGIDDMVEFAVERVRKRRTQQSADAEGRQAPRPDNSFPSLQYDHIRLKNASVGGRIVKLRAEICMLRCVSIAWGISALTSLLVILIDSVPWSLLPGCFVIGATAMGFSRHRLRRKMYNSIRNHAELLGVSPRDRGVTDTAADAEPASETDDPCEP